MDRGRELGGEFVKSPEVLGLPETVLILDGGAQYVMDIEQQIKRLGFHAKRMPLETTLEEVQALNCKAVVFSGGPESVYEEGSPMCDPRLVTPGIDHPPALGICYGAQLITHILGGKVEALETREDGFTEIIVDSLSSVFSGTESNQTVLMSHGDTVTELPPGFEATAYSGELIAAFANPEQKLYGLQFHPEVSTAEGPVMLRNFLCEVAGMAPEYSYSNEEFVEDTILDVRNQVGEREVLAFVSGGVDSSALGALLERALPPEQVHLVYVDNGFMRLGESQYVTETLSRAGINISVYDAAEMFYSGTTIIDGIETPPLYEVVEPEVKRKIIGDTFIKVQDHMAEELGLDLDNFMLAMGTLHTDLIESGSKHASQKADTIKSHHNDTEAVRKLRDAGRVLEPWRFIQKDDVREVAALLDLPDEIVNRQPFPGPGLAIRIICKDSVNFDDSFFYTAEKLASFDTPDIKTSLLPIQTVGVQGDHRTYGHLVGLSGKEDWQELIRIAREIPRQVHGVNRVVYIFGEHPGPAVYEITPTHLTLDNIEQLRRVDSIVNKKLKAYGLDRSISQVPVISFPVNFGKPGNSSIGIRTILTPNFKTGDVAIPGIHFEEHILKEIVDDILKIVSISRVVYDLTSKPPATTEWE